MLRISAAEDTIIYAGSLFDGLREPLPQKVAIVVRDGRIMEIAPGLTPEEQSTETGFRVISLPGLTLLPALIDCHVHLALNGVDFQGALQSWEGGWLPMVQKSLEDSLKLGLGLIRDGGDGGRIGLTAKQLVQRGQLRGPQILSAGQAIYKKGRYGSFLGPGIENVDEAFKMIDALQLQGVDWIKVLVSGIVSFKEYGKVGAPQFPRGELKCIVDYAHAAGLPVMAHASSDQAVAQSLDAGVDSVEHGYFVSAASLRALAESNIPWVPTVVPVANQVHAQTGTEHPSESADIITKTYELQLRKIAEALSLGVQIGIGTDAGASGVRHGFDYLRELELFAQAGLRAVDVLKSATAVSARVCGMDRELGTIAPGRRASIIGVAGNPLTGLEALREIRFVMG